MNGPLWFSNLLFWSAQVALLAVAAAFLLRLFQIQEPRVLLVYWRALIAISLMLPLVEPWHRVPGVGAMAISPDIAGPSFISTSSPVVKHWHFPGIQTISEVFGVVILVGIAARFVLLGRNKKHSISGAKGLRWYPTVQICP